MDLALQNLYLSYALRWITKIATQATFSHLAKNPFKTINILLWNSTVCSYCSVWAHYYMLRSLCHTAEKWQLAMWLFLLEQKPHITSPPQKIRVTSKIPSWPARGLYNFCHWVQVYAPAMWMCIDWAHARISIQMFLSMLRSPEWCN